MMAKLKALIGARWFPYALIGVVAVVSSAYGLGWWRGYRYSDLRCEAEKGKALEHQIEQDRKIVKRDTRIIANVEAKSLGAKHEIESAPVAGVGMCSTDECMQFFNGAINSYNAHTGRTAAEM